MELLNVKNLKFSYGKSTVLNDISFSLEPGKIFCIIGPNGCGKSTLLDCIMGFNKIQSGSIHINEKDTAEMKPNELASFISYVPQNHRTTFSYSVLQVVMMGQARNESLISGFSEEVREDALKALESVGLSDFADRDYTTLSGGELQLVLIARAIAQQAKIMVLDEPTAHLDFRHELSVLETISKLVKENGISVVMATHFLNQAYFLENQNIVTSVGLIEHGKFDEIGNPSEVLIPEKLEKVFNIVTELATDESGTRRYILSLHNK